MELLRAVGLGLLLLAASAHGYVSKYEKEAVSKSDTAMFRSEWWDVEEELASLKRIAAQGLQATLAEEEAVGPKSFLQKVRSAPKPADKAAPAKPANKTAPAAPASKIEEAAGLAKLTAKDAAGGKAGMLVAQAMMEGMYERAKHKVSQMNKQEVDSKAEYLKRNQTHFEKIRSLEENHKRRHADLVAHLKNLTDHPRIKNATLLNATKARWAWMLHNEEGGYVNATRNENRDAVYWKTVRDSEHAQFRNLLRMQHATMDRLKTTMKLYEKVLSGKYDKAKIVRALQAVKKGAVPNAKDVAFLDHALSESDEAAGAGARSTDLRQRELASLKVAQRELVRYCDEAIGEVHMRLGRKP